MRRTKRFAGFALAACMGVSLLVNVPAGTVLAEEPTEMVVADIAETSEADFEWDGTKITKYKANGADVVIPSRCTEIGDRAFQSKTELESVTKIENSAFWGCVNLKTIRGYAVSYVESYAKEYGYIFEDVEGKITTSYRTHVQSFGWQNPVTNGAMSGTSGEAKRLEAIQIKLYGEMANRFDVYYRVHAQSYGWLGWAKNGEESGTAGYAKRLEGIQIVLVPKGSAAPANNYKNIQSVHTKAYIKK